MATTTSDQTGSKIAPASFTTGKLIRPVIHLPYLIWEFTQSNFNTFVIPNTTFGLLGALVPAFSAATELEGPPSVTEILVRAPSVVLFNWCNVLVFDLGNQRSIESVEEDVLNKPWRPIPTGKATSNQARCALLLLIPISMWLNHALGVWEQGVLIPTLSYLYNDLRGGDELLRDPIISIAYAVANSASLRIAVGGHITPEAFTWVSVISGVILTTMQVQDLKDQAGDRSRGRRTIALFVGEWFSRTCIAFFVGFWSLVCTWLWNPGPVAFGLSSLTGLNVMRRVLLKRTPAEDARTWKWWCLWTVTLYSLPAFAMVRGFHEP
ncbi:hypothetical protein JX266_002387 [Neoarthrinium moseri]|nr:hypothetical protein JX266_002387 [Neoarthrinium moseri]